jgi:hypothetical protein
MIPSRHRHRRVYGVAKDGIKWRTAMSDQPSIDNHSPASDVAAAMAVIQTIDLTGVMRKLRHKEDWTEAQATTAAMRYRRFLCMHYLDRQLHIAAASDIDKVWHQHILHTREYADDCQRVFGAFLHHGAGSEDSEAAQEHLRINVEKTRARYAELFGEEYVETWLSYFLL